MLDALWAVATAEEYQRVEASVVRLCVEVAREQDGVTGGVERLQPAVHLVQLGLGDPLAVDDVVSGVM